MSMLKQQFRITTWSQRSVAAGSSYLQETTRYMQTADIVLLLISPDFLATYGTSLDTISQALQRHHRNEALVIPVLLRPSDWAETELSHLQPLPSNSIPITLWHNRDEAYVDIVAGIRMAIIAWIELRKEPDQQDAIQEKSPPHEYPLISTTGNMLENDPRTQPVFFFNAPFPGPQEFYGRLRERTKLLDRVVKLSATSIVGPRRIGKSWLMQYARLTLPERLGPRFRIAFIDATSPSCSDIEGFVYTILTELRAPQVYLSATHYNLAVLEKAVKDIRSQGEAPVLFIDEFEGLTNEQTFNLRFFTGLRAIAQAGLVLVVASKRPLIDLVSNTLKTSPFFNIFEKLTLKPFTAKEAENFITTKSLAASFTTQEQERFLLYGCAEQGACLPIRLQLVGTMLLEEKTLAEQEGQNDYCPSDPAYLHDFEQRLAEKYQEVVRSE